MEASRLRRPLRLLAAAMLMSASGCRIMQPLPDAVPAESPSELGRLLANHLQKDRWRLNAAWSALEEVKRSRSHEPFYRWVYGSNAGSPDVAFRSQSAESDSGPGGSKPSQDGSQAAPRPSDGTNPVIRARRHARQPSAEGTAPARAASPHSGTAPTGARPEEEPDSAVRERFASEDRAGAGQADESRVWDGFWPLDPIRALAARPADGVAVSEFLQALRELTRRKGLVGWNASILLAQRDPTAGREVRDNLERLVAGSAFDRPQDAPELPSDSEASEREAGPSVVQPSPALRAAAAEAWCHVLIREAPAAGLEERQNALAPAGRLLRRPELPNSVRGELFRGCARWIPPDRIPRLANALQRAPDGQRAPAAIRRAAMEACLLFALYKSEVLGIPTATAAPATGLSPSDRAARTTVRRQADYEEQDWPQSIWNGQDDPDARVRILFGRWLAAARPPDAHDRLCRQLDDQDITVREEASVSLGRLGTAAALATLRRQAERPEARIRRSAVRGLAEWGPGELTRFLDDEAFSVRVTVARELARFPQARAAVLLQRLVADRSAEVQKQAIDAVADWPDEIAIPVLLRGLRDGTLANRQRCRERISRRLGTDVAITVEAPREERVRQITRLVQQYGWAGGLLKALQAEELRTMPTITDQRKSEITSWLETVCRHTWGSEPSEKAWQKLRQIAPEEVTIVERFASERRDADSEVLYTEVLPRLDAAYAALRNLSSPEVAVRRRAAQKLASLGQARSLTPFMVRRLRDLLAQEQDSLVWRFAMQAIMRDDNDEAAQLALLAVNHAWPDIRLLGCRYIARHGRPQYARWLLPLLHDANREVQLEAVRAAGLCRNPIVLDGLPHPDSSEAIASGGLRSLLNHQDARIRLATAVSMSRLGDDQGMQELTRLSYHSDAQLRIEVIRAIGRTGRARFIEHLVRLAWTEKHPAVKRAILRSLEELTPTEELPRELATATNDDDRIYAWVAWWQGRRASRQPSQRNKEGSVP